VASGALVLGAILLAALAFRVPGLGESLWYDEMWSTRVKLGSPDLAIRTIAADVHPPLYTVVMYGWIRVFGDSEISVRLLPLASGLLTIVLAARLGQEYGGRIAGTIAALLLAVSPVHIWYSQEARHYSLLLLLLLACVWTVHRIRETGAARWYVTYAFLALCFVFTHYYAMAYIGVLTALAVRDPRLRRPMLAIGGVATAALALFLAAKARLWGLATEVGSSGTFELADLWRLPFEWFVTGGVFGPPDARVGAARAAILLVQVAFLGLVVIGLARAGRRGAGHEARGFAPRAELAILLLVLPLALLALGAMGRRGFYVERSALTALPFFAMAVGVGVASLRPAALRAAAVLLLVAVGGVVLASFYAKRDAWTVYKPNPDWRAIGRTLAAEHARTGAPVVVISMSPALELTYYASLELTPYPPASSIRDPAPDRAGRVYVLSRPDVDLVREIFARERVRTLYFAHNEYWLGTDPPNHVVQASRRLAESLENDASFAATAAGAAKGITLLRVEPAGPR
jgi:4-amino-4-deoxy-L-arabinose transferase-like glycosyltransferase